MMVFLRVHPTASFVIFATGWLIVAYSALRPFTLQRLNDRLPFMLCVPSYLLEMALLVLPKAFPQAFDTILGHSIYFARYDTDLRWIDRWGAFVGWFYILGIILGGGWAVVNLIKQRAWIMNTLAVVAALFIFVATWYLIQQAARLL
jgi:hypothetical protein